MIFTRSLLPALALVLAACGGAEQSKPAADWRAALEEGDGVGAEMALRAELDQGAAVGDLAPFLGQAELLQGDLREARRWLGDGNFSPATMAHGNHMLGRLRMREGDLAGAGKAFDKALRLAPAHPALWVDIARLRYRGGEHRQAAEASRKALELGPDDPDALLLRAQMVRDGEGAAAALPLLKRGLEDAPRNADLLADYAASLGELGRGRDMLAAVRRLAAASPGDPRALYLQAVLAARAGKGDLARSLLQRLGGLDRDLPAAVLLLGLVDLDNGNPASAAQGFDRLLRRQPDNPRVAALLAHALAASGNDRELIARFGGRADSRYLALLVGRAHENLGARDVAAPYLDRALGPVRGPRLGSLPPEIPLGVAAARGTVNGADTVALVRGLIAARGTGEVRNAAQKWLRRHPGSADAMALAGDAALASGDPRGALGLYRASAKVRRTWPLTKRMAAALEATGQAVAAEALVAEHFAGEPGNAEAAALLARSHAVRGDAARAGSLWAYARARGG